MSSMNPFDGLSNDEFDRYYESLRFVLQWEKGYVNDPDDPGGETKWGISKRYHPTLDIKNLTPQEAAEIYYEEYWRPSKAYEHSIPLCTVVFDTAVLCGVGRATQWYRESEGDIPSFLDIRRRHHMSKSKPKHLKGHLNRVADLQKFCELKA